MRIEKVGGGYAICADSTQASTALQVRQFTGDVALVLADPPYGNILPSKWDVWSNGEDRFVEWMLDWTQTWQRVLLPNAALYVWAGIGTPNFRPFYGYMWQLEKRTTLKIANHITWKKKRAYGIKHNYLFTREECVYLINGPDIKKPRRFNIPLLEEKRGYAGYVPKYPAKSEFYRRTNVWTDVTEVMRGKAHAAQKAQRVIEVPIEVHTSPGEWVIDPFAGSGITALAARKLGRRFVVIEKDTEIFEQMLTRLRVNQPSDEVVSDHAQEHNEDPDSTTHCGDEAGHRPGAS